MNIHQNARLTIARRLEMVQDVLQRRLTYAGAAAAHGVSVPTVRKWVGPGVYPASVPNDALFGSQWDLMAAPSEPGGINAPAAWDFTRGSPLIYIAVIDTGILPHPDLVGRYVGGYDFITSVISANDGDGRDSDPTDPGDWRDANECGAGSPAQSSSWHGTHVAGTIGAMSNNGTGIAGINWISKIVPLRVLGSCGGTFEPLRESRRLRCVSYAALGNSES